MCRRKRGPRRQSSPSPKIIAHCLARSCSITYSDNSGTMGCKKSRGIGKDRVDMKSAGIRPKLQLAFVIFLDLNE